MPDFAFELGPGKITICQIRVSEALDGRAVQMPEKKI
jgi:hypothetical protein